MIIRTLGNKENPVIIMIPGMFCTYEMPGIIAEYLKDDFCILLPTLDGHHKEEPIYHSKQEDASKIDIPVDRFLFDGGPFFHFPGFYRAFMAKKFMSFMKTTKGKPKEQAIDALMNDPFVKKLGGDSLEAYRGLMGGFCEVSQWIEKDSVRRISDTCYKCDLPDFPDDTVRRFVFLYSEKEPARIHTTSSIQNRSAHSHPHRSTHGALPYARTRTNQKDKTDSASPSPVPS